MRTDAFKYEEVKTGIFTVLLLLFFQWCSKKNKKKIKKLDDWNRIWLHVGIKYNLSPVTELTFLWNIDSYMQMFTIIQTKPSISLFLFVHRSVRPPHLPLFHTDQATARIYGRKFTRKSTSADLWAFDKCDSHRNVRKWNWWQRRFITRTGPPGNQRLFKNTVYIGFL